VSVEGDVLDEAGECDGAPIIAKVCGSHGECGIDSAT
jgi:hypothetical protein